MTPTAPHDPDHNRPPTPKEKAMSKQIEPTDAMVDAVESARELVVLDVRAILRSALNHPDAPGLFTTEDDRPWEPLNGLPRVGDEVRQDRPGTTITAVVGRVDEVGDPWATGGNFIGRLDLGTWYVRRHIQELPTEDGAQIIPAHGAIEAVRNGVTYKAARATYDAVKRVWVGVWRGEGGRSTYEMPASLITLRTAQGVE